MTHTFCDLGMSPLSNAYLKAERLKGAEPFFPLHAYVCERCFLVQLEEFESPENIFSDYAYFSSYSASWLKHAENYTIEMIERFGFNAAHQVIEIASNDGYLLQYFKERSIPVLGIEPAANVAEVAREKGIPTRVCFFGTGTARSIVAEGGQADLLLGNNVLAHVPDLNDFVAGLKIVLKDDGVITMEFPHLLRLMEKNQFDTIYHEHFSYFSLITVVQVFRKHGLSVFDVQELATHGGSLRIFACHEGNADKAATNSVEALLAREAEAGLSSLSTYLSFGEKVRETKRSLLQFLIQAKKEGKKIACYGAAAKGNTLLNYCGIRSDFIDFVVDLSPHKQGLFLPGTHLPINHPDRVREEKPDYLLILPWNIKDEITTQMSYIREWGGQFVVPIPSVEVLP
nr:class I SAM-dependent methyltransferase [Geomonas subterranea]